MAATDTFNLTTDDVLGSPLHPYYPLGVTIPGYVAKILTTQEILGIFTATCLSILVPTWLYIRHVRPNLSASQVSTALWFVLCGFIHLGLEGKFQYHLPTADAYRNSPSLATNIVRRPKFQVISHSTRTPLPANRQS
jgi:hypothetical protein